MPTNGNVPATKAVEELVGMTQVMTAGFSMTHEKLYEQLKDHVESNEYEKAKGILSHMLAIAHLHTAVKALQLPPEKERDFAQHMITYFRNQLTQNYS